jgi:hypothetical protein
MRAIVDIRVAPSSSSPVSPASAPRLNARTVHVLCDDPLAAAPWVVMLAAEGLSTRCAPLDGAAHSAEAPPDAWVLHVTRGLPI